MIIDRCRYETLLVLKSPKIVVLDKITERKARRLYRSYICAYTANHCENDEYYRRTLIGIIIIILIIIIIVLNG